MLDVIIAGAGPAGSVAALVLARAGARVLLLDRETFPRDKLCGDTVNPGAVARLRALGLEGGPLATARSLAGMRVSGPTTTVTAPYGDGQRALALTRRALDTWLLEAAIAAGARFESGLVVREPLVDDTRGRPLVRGLCVSRGSDAPATRLPAMITIAADGRRSTIARACIADERGSTFKTCTACKRGAQPNADVRSVCARSVQIARGTPFATLSFA